MGLVAQPQAQSLLSVHAAVCVLNCRHCYIHSCCCLAAVCLFGAAMATAHVTKAVDATIQSLLVSSNGCFCLRLPPPALLSWKLVDAWSGHQHADVSVHWSCCLKTMHPSRHVLLPLLCPFKVSKLLSQTKVHVHGHNHQAANASSH